MKVSIITIVYNNIDTIEDCINSVLAQTYSDVEYILIDGLSSDGTLNLVNSYSDKIDVIVSEKDKGLYDALNKGVLHATGDVVGILHSDDVFYDVDVLSRVVETFKKSRSDIVYGNGVYTSRSNLNQIRRIYKSSPFKNAKLKYGWVPLHTCIYAKREVFDKYGLYDTNYSIASDYEITLRWFLNEKISKNYLDSFLVKMRLGGKSTTLKLQKMKSAEDLEIIQKYNLSGYRTLFCKILRKLPQYLKGCYMLKDN
ncbi:glycosyltransferase family 2 protein [Natronoflexus pectinivorans]|uniref:Glycosyltransferase n=1 Tax=Natronoflexus pectinivorans TaxID=682526 RepID=A0A4R2GI47_9BACT|nr:glycosyltransferase family 2 protein [Natronoflexus pectinivorans]TCO07880.1 glycosyltransferase [Natronoflexus pectinivorans]